MATILVVDDELGIRALLSEILTDEGHSVELAENAAQARAARERARPDLVLLDIGMPGIDGWETARLLRANQEQNGRGHLPIIIISADAFEAGRTAAAGIAARDYLVKPVGVATLLGRIREVLDLVWIAGPAIDDRHDDTLPDYLAQPLRELGALGHVRGILSKLDEIDRLDSRYLRQTSRLRASVKAFQLADYLRALGAEAK